MTIGKLQILLPIILCDRVLSGAQVVANRLSQRFVRTWPPGGDIDAAQAKQAIDRLGM
jgi:hypothetical protein